MTDPLHDRLAALGEGPVPPLAPSAEVRARGARRRTRVRAAVGGAAAVAVLLGGGSAYALSGRDGHLQLAEQAPTPGACGPATTADCRPPLDLPVPPGESAAPRGQLPPTPAEPPCGGDMHPGPCDPSAAVGQPLGPPPPDPSPPADLRPYVLTTQDAAAVDQQAWAESATSVMTPLEPCPGGTEHPRDLPHEARTSRTLVTSRDTRDLLQEVTRYASADLAAQAATGYAEAARDCPGSAALGTDVAWSVVRTDPVQGVPTTWVRRTRSCETCTTSSQYYAVQQRGAVVSVLGGSRNDVDDDPGVALVDPFARRVAERLQDVPG